MTKKNTLFVSIASYRDPELLPTLKNMLVTAKHSHKLHVAVCWQYDNDDISLFTNVGMQLTEHKDCGEYQLWRFRWLKAQIDIIGVHYYHSQGACWARYMTETRYRGETYSLQIDSHCRFVVHWDSKIVAMLEGLREISSKPVLSTYPPPYDPHEADEKRGKFVSRLIFREFSNEGLPMFSSTPIEVQAPQRGSYIAGGFIFADGRFIREVANDPHIFFAGEEIAMAARAFTHGYDVYTPHQIILWHYYGRKDASKVWGDHNRNAKETGEVAMAWWERDALSKKRIRSLFGLEDTPQDLGQYGLGTQRSLREFEQTVGIDFRRRAVLPEVVEGEKISYFSPACWLTEEEWALRLTSPLRKKLTLKKVEMPSAPDEDAWWHLGIYTANNRLIEKKIYSLTEMNALVDAGNEEEFSLNVHVNAKTLMPPATIRLCAFHDDIGWGEVLETAW